MKITVLSIIIFFSYLTGFSQAIKGTILDYDTKKPIDYAVAYFNGTFLGTSADKNGNFEIKFSESGSKTLTISALGYYSVDISDYSEKKILKVFLKTKAIELNEILINPGNIKKDKRERGRDLKLFRKQFLGDTPNGRLCKILNEEDISFRNETDTFKAFASKPIFIENKALGYKITFFMDRFDYIPGDKTMYWNGNILFNEDLGSIDVKNNKFERNRIRTYVGSRMQFFRALWDGKLDSVGFKVKDNFNRKLSSADMLYPIKSPDGLKCLKFYDKIYIKHKSEKISEMAFNSFLASPGVYSEALGGSMIRTMRDSVYFDRNGAQLKDILIYGTLGKQRIADIMPYEYDPSPLASKLLMDSAQSNLSLEYSNNNNNINNIKNSLPIEKVYLHLDRTSFMQGDTIWFKAYAWFGFEQIPDTLNKILYVELLNSKDSVQIRKKLLIQGGTSNGEFTLRKDILPGKYLVRAYTHWMQNENAGEPFYQVITIGSLRQNFQVDCSSLIIREKDKDSLKLTLHFYEIDPQGDLKKDFSHKVDYKLRIGDQQLNTERALSFPANPREQILKFPLPAKKDSLISLYLAINEQGLNFEREFRIPLDDGLDLQFFPEGGALVNGIFSRVAFKAIGRDGLGRDIKGMIKTADGKIVASIQSFRKGMGDFYLTPEKGKKYQATVTYNERELKYNLPDAVDSGCGLKIEKGDSAFSATILYTPEMENSKMYLTGSAYGKLRFISALKLTPDSSEVKIPVEFLPEGISRVTLLNDFFKPVCERLVYADKRERFKIEVKADSLHYGTRSKVTLHIRTTDWIGKPLPANLSLSVTDQAQVKGLESLAGISAYKLLETELKGTIEDPGYYFKGDSLHSRALDLLLLTQGYRRFMPDSSKKEAFIRYYPERSFEIGGKVVLRGDKGRNFNYSTLGLTILCPSDKTFFDQTKPDSTGNFYFQLPLQSGRPLSLVRAYTSKGKLTREKFPKEKSFKGDILLNEDAGPQFEIPKISEIITATPLIEYVQQLQQARKNEISKIKNGDKWHLNLPEVTVTAKYKDKEWYTHFEDEAKKIVDMDSIDPTGKKYGNLYDLLVREFDARKCYTENRETETIELPCINNPEGNCRTATRYYPVYVLNGVTFCNAGEDSLIFTSLLRNLYSIRVNEIKTLMVLPPGNIAYHYAEPNVVSGFGPLKQISHEGPICGSMKQSLVVIETYHKHNFYRGDPDGIKTFILEGLDAPRSFYSPKYEGSNKENPDFDSRATLLWKPVIRTNEKGESQVEFYTSDRKSGFQVTVNGMGIFNGETGECKK